MMKKLALPLLALSFLALAPLALAQTTQTTPVNTSTTQTTPVNTGGLGTSGSNIQLINPLKAGTSLESLLAEILDFVTRIGTIVIVLMVIYSGFKFVMARGEPGAIAEARQMLMWTVVGALILLGAKAIAVAIEATAKAL